MDFQQYSDVVLQQDIPEHNLRSGDIGTVVERHDVVALELGYSVEFFDLLGNTVAVATVPGHCLRVPTPADRSTVRTTAQH